MIVQSKSANGDRNGLPNSRRKRRSRSALVARRDLQRATVSKDRATRECIVRSFAPNIVSCVKCSLFAARKMHEPCNKMIGVG